MGEQADEGANGQARAGSASHERATVDERWMEQAIDLARQGIGLASPNPTVGCVLVRGSHLVGSGFHEYDRRDHAEIVALRGAGDLARGATAYVTLEPCSHHGRTGPCTDAFIAAGLARVVVATVDANPAVHGQGVDRLRRAGIEVTAGVLQAPARRLNDAFAKYIRTGGPFVTLKAAMTLDGRIAPSPSARQHGQISWITGAESQRHVHQLRHSVDAVLTGIGTVLADDPLLTDRSGMARRRRLLRVVLDSDLRLPIQSKLVQSAESDLLVFCSEVSGCSEASGQRLRSLTSAGVSVVPIASAADDARLSLALVLERLGAMQIASVMVEGGSRINASFLTGSWVDRLFLFYAPYFLGNAAQPVLASTQWQRPTVRDFALHRFGSDFAFEGWLNDPWQP